MWRESKKHGCKEEKMNFDPIEMKTKETIEITNAKKKESFLTPKIIITFYRKMRSAQRFSLK